MASSSGAVSAEEDLEDLLESALEDFAKSSPASATPAQAQLSNPGDATGSECDVSRADSPPAGAEGVKGLGMPALRDRRKRKNQKQLKETKKSSAPSSPAAGTSSSSRGEGGGVGQSVKEKEKEKEKGKGRGKMATLQQLAQSTRQTVEGIRVQEADSAAAAARATASVPGKERGGLGDADVDADEGEMVEKLVKQFEEMGTGDIQGLMDSMLQQLLSKDVLQEPMMEIRDRYPAWLSANQGKLSPEDLGRYSRQYECIQRLCRLYETNPDDFSTILACMKEMQECGQPPADIIRDLAPGLELGEDGLPMIPDVGSGDFPSNCPTM